MINPKPNIAGLEQRGDFDDIIDVRTPLEFSDDHIPGAINAPVLTNQQRVEIGTLYKEAPFEATRRGAAMVAQNIAAHLNTLFADKPRQWRPLVYCWRGGKRSGAMTAWLNLIGWRARQLEGGYKTYRRDVLSRLDTLPPRFRYIVLAGHTGCGKTRLLQALAQAGAQVLDLEQLACHRGSLLGALPDCPQPSQKAFESALVARLSAFDSGAPVFIEAESKRIGRLALPATLLDTFHQGAYVTIRADLDERIRFLMRDYAHLFDDPCMFKQLLAHLTGLHSKATIAQWHALIDADDRTELFRQLIVKHYDPAYSRSSAKSFGNRAPGLEFTFEPNSSHSLDQARALLAQTTDLRNTLP
jgi:tRNA 2-selenouridine synthase